MSNPAAGTVVDRAALGGTPLEAARAVLGAHLVHDAAENDRRVGRIVEVEAYGGPEDRASHARAGATARAGVMFGPPGIAYVYLVYGMYDCLNVVCGGPGVAGAILLRAVEPIAGIMAMRSARLALTAARRRRPAEGPSAAGTVRAGRAAATSSGGPRSDARLASGPGRLCAAFGVDRTMTGLDLCDPRSPLRLELAGPDDRRSRPAWTPRIGVAYAGEPWASMPWRLVDGSSDALSRA